MTSTVRLLTASVALAALTVPVPARAGALVLTELIADRGVKDQQVADVFSLMSSELEFMDGVAEVIELSPRPPALDLKCLDSTRCLGTLTREALGDHLLGGAVESLGDELALDLVFYDVTANRVLRRQTYTVPSDPVGLVDALTPVLREIVTGETPAQRAEESLGGVDFGGDLADDDLAFEQRPVQPAPQPAPPPSGTVNAERVDRPIEAPAPADDAFDPNAFSFESTADDVAVGSEPVYEPPPPPPPPRDDERTLRGFEDDLDEFEEEMELEGGRLDFDETSSSTRKDDDSGVTDWRRVYVPVRGGFSTYGIFFFGTAGAELQVRAAEGLTFVLGAEAYIVTRALPEEQVEATGRTVETSFIVPFNGGILYRFKPGRFQPYLGVDAQASQYFIDATTQQRKFTVGARGRLGFDYFISRNFGFNVDVALGFWSGNNWPDVDNRLPTIGFTPRVAGGFVLGF